MTSRPGAAALVMAAVALEGAEQLIAAHVEAGVGALLFPGALLRDPARLSGLTSLARRLAAEAGRPGMLCAAGGWAAPAAAWPAVPGLPSPLSIAALRDGARARREASRLGFLTGLLAARAGIDLVFGPCLDLATDPKAEGGILDGFGEEPVAAGRLGTALAAGLARAGVAACGIRFPGCGSLVPDQRHGLPKLPMPRERLETVELPPFARAIHAGLPAVLVARALVPALEGERVPAARSDFVIEGLLRSRLGFRGLVIGDALDSPGGADPEGAGRGALLSVLAGCDLTLCLGAEAVLAATAALESAVASGDLPLSRVSVARGRLSGLLAHAGSRGGREAAAISAGFTTRAARRAAKRAVEYAAERASERVAEDSATLLRAPAPHGRERPPMISGAAPFVLVFLPSEGSPDGSTRDAFLAALAEGLPGAEIHTAHADPEEGEGEAVLAALAAAPQSGAGRDGGREALALSCDAHVHPSQESLIHVLEESMASVSVIAMRDPYDASFFPRSRALGAVYGFSPASARVAARLALGSLEARGRCPVEVLGLEV